MNFLYSAQAKEGRYVEGFQYDALNRLTQAALTQVNGVTTNTPTLQQEYDALGNICARLFHGQLTGMGYGGRAGCGVQTAHGSGGTGTVGPHQVTTLQAAGGAWSYQWDARGNQTVRDAPGTANDRTIQYSLDDHAYEIVTGNGQRTRYWYGPDGQRYQREDADGTRTLYIGQVEVLKQGATTRYRRNLGVLVRTEQGATAEDRFVFADRLGSVVKYTDGNGTVYQPQDYDGWGQRRSTADPTQAGTAPTPPIALRGYTGQEMVDGQDVIHMNARLYDPVLGRFLQADPLIQAPENLQSWNAYTYVLNNPLTLVDPTGMFSWSKFFRVVIGVVVAIYAPHLFMTYMKLSAFAATVATGFVSGALGTGTLKGALIGALTAGLTYGIAQGLTGNTPTDGLAEAEQLTPGKDQIAVLRGAQGAPSEGIYRINIAGNGTFLDAKAIGAMDIRSGDIIFTNGIKNSFADAVRNGTTQIFQATGGLPSSYVLNFNQSTSFMGDILESAKDITGAYFNAGNSDLAKSLAQTVHIASKNGVTGLQLIGHSQGGAITASALRYANANGLSLTALQGGSVALHGAPINNVFATRYLAARIGVPVTVRAQFGDVVNNVLGLNFMQNPLRLPASFVRAPGLLSREIQISPHTSPCLGARSGICN